MADTTYSEGPVPAGGGTLTCTNTASVAVAAGHYLQVRIATPSGGTFGSNRTWRVSFRY